MKRFESLEEQEHNIKSEETSLSSEKKKHTFFTNYHFAYRSNNRDCNLRETIYSPKTQFPTVIQ